MRNKVLAVAALTLGGVLLPGAAAYAYGELGEFTTATAGDSVAIPVSDLPNNNPVTIEVNSNDGDAVISTVGLVTYTDTPVGNAITFNVVFPNPGEYAITVYQEAAGSDPFNLVGSFTVDVAAVPSDGEMPSTGVDSAALIWFGGGAAVLGAALIVVLALVRRNRNKATVSA